jgi:hypothetical protein
MPHGKESIVIERIDQNRTSPLVRTPNERGSQFRRSANSKLVEGVPGIVGPPVQWGMSSSTPLRGHGDCGLTRKIAVVAQRHRLVHDVAVADLEAAEAAFGAFHPTTWHFRNSLNEARRAWERLRAELGTRVLEASLSQPPLTMLTLGEQANGSPPIVLVLIDGKTYRIQQVTGTELAPIQWRLTRLHPPIKDGPYYVCRLANQLTQCDCAEWTYRIAETDNARNLKCKHLAALSSLGWI